MLAKPGAHFFITVVLIRFNATLGNLIAEAGIVSILLVHVLPNCTLENLL